MVNIDRIIQDFGNTLVSFNQGEKHLGFFKIEGIHSNKDYIIFTFNNCKGLWVECSEFEKLAFFEYD